MKIYFDNRILHVTSDGEKFPQDSDGNNYTSPTSQQTEEIVTALEDGKLREATVRITGDIRKHLKSHFTITIAGGGIIFNGNDEILLIFRRGKWDLPKGKQEDGESDEESALRECTEETGLKNISIIRQFGSTFHVYRMHGERILKETKWYLMQWSGNETMTPQTEEDISELKWVSVFHLPEYFDKTYDSLKELLERLHAAV
ncbi:MAG: NUDIX domain-containing protein [Chitinophagaceae bacterium]|nr:NUDIX domain-containing protein [Chitinophagaceae bacterium]